MAAGKTLSLSSIPILQPLQPPPASPAAKLLSLCVFDPDPYSSRLDLGSFLRSWSPATQVVSFSGQGWLIMFDASEAAALCWARWRRRLRCLSGHQGTTFKRIRPSKYDGRIDNSGGLSTILAYLFRRCFVHPLRRRCRCLIVLQSDTFECWTGDTGEPDPVSTSLLSVIGPHWFSGGPLLVFLILHALVCGLK